MISEHSILLVNAYLDGELILPVRSPLSSGWRPIRHLRRSARASTLCSDYCANGCSAKLRRPVCAPASRHQSLGASGSLAQGYACCR
jgi:hypothetical protein